MVSMNYKPAAVNAGIVLSILSVCFIVVLIVIEKKKHSRVFVESKTIKNN